ncbi:MAG TPA: sigma-70 family RNA polymerase sigma factor [Blastocatellia bacterium]|nr:sigma-70 family RNA polymerase sigma factor [Blastocatellia bacterium]
MTAEVFEADRRLLWGLCYRMTGNAADADDLVQETFVKAIEHPPRRTDEPLRPWLVRVAMNLSRDLLRRRKRRSYVGEWLPSPVPTEDEDTPASYEPPAPGGDSPAARYDLMESVSFAFLLALEALTPTQRAALLLRDVFDYSTAETAAALDITEANVKVLLLRARRRMREYDKSRMAFSAARREATGRALEQFLLCLNERDAEGLERLLTEDVESISDGGGEVHAALRPIKGRDKVLRLIAGIGAKFVGKPRASVRMLNGLPAVLFEDVVSTATRATRYTLHVEVDDSGRIRRLDAVLAPAKLSAIK